jgi:hypothetical protein
MISKELLSKTDFEVLNNIQAELDETFKKVQVHRTRTEMEVSVLNDLKFPTPASKYWQAMREQNVMLSGVTALSFEYRMEKVRLKKIIRKMLKTEDKLDKELLQIKKEKKEYILKEMERSAAHKVREILEWSDIKNREASVMSKEELENVDNHQLISYTRRWINQAIEMGNNGSPSEKQNLIGQLKSGIAMCKNKNVLRKTLEPYSEDHQQYLIEACDG